MEDNKFITAVSKAMDIIELLDSVGPMGISEISRHLGLAKSGVHKTLNTLKARHYVRQDPVTQKYANSYKFFSIGSNVVQNTSLPQMASPFMLKISQSIKCSANLAVLQDQSVYCIHRIETDATVKVTIKTGQVVPLHCSGLGKALTFLRPYDELKALFQGYHFEKCTHNTIDNFEDLAKELAVSKERGYSVDDEEHNLGIMGIAAPVCDDKGRPMAALSAAMALMAHNERPDPHTIGPLMRQIAGELTVYLGGRPAAYGR